jgi:hypothetical protein
MANSVAVTLPKVTAAAGTVFLTVDRLREYVSSGLTDAALQVLLDAAWDAIEDASPSADVRERLTGRGNLLMLSQPAASVTSVIERAQWSPVTLTSDDYELSTTGRVLYRLRTGTNPGWHWQGHVDITYRPDVDVATRIAVAIDLVKFDLSRSAGLVSQSVGSWTETYQQSLSHSQQRAEILARLDSGPVMF